MIPGIDASHWNGDINWPAVVAAGIKFAIVKISGGDAGLYYDSKATANYYGSKAAGMQGVGGYHFAGGGDPIQEADFFIAGMKPFVENDLWVLDFEISLADPVNWCAAFLQRCHDVAGVWPILYMNGSTANAHAWNDNAIIANCGKWIAWYGKDPSGTLPVSMFYMMHQYSSTGSVPGIAGNIDQDMFFGTIEQLNKYGWHAPATPPQPVVSTGQVSETKDVPFASISKESDQLAKGVKQLSQSGHNGVETLTYSVTYTDGKETNRVLISDVVTVLPIDEVTLVGTYVKSPTPEPTPNPIPEPAPTSAPSQDTLFTELARLWAAIAQWLKSWHR